MPENLDVEPWRTDAPSPPNADSVARIRNNVIRKNAEVRALRANL